MLYAISRHGCRGIVRVALRRNRSRLIRSLEHRPDDLDGRDPLWVERFELLRIADAVR